MKKSTLQQGCHVCNGKKVCSRNPSATAVKDRSHERRNDMCGNRLVRELTCGELLDNSCRDLNPRA